MVSMVRETYAPVLLRRLAAKKRQETGDERWWSRYDDKEPFLPLLKANLSRPFILTVTEPILYVFIAEQAHRWNLESWLT